MSETPDSKRRLTRIRVITLIAGLLILWVGASTIALFGQEGSKAFPSIANTKPSGAAAFAELLRRDGYTVKLDRDQRPRLNPEDVAIALNTNWANIDFGDAADGLDLEDPFEESIEKHLKEGGTVVRMTLSDDFGQATLKESPADIALGKNTYNVSTGELFSTFDGFFDDSETEEETPQTAITLTQTTEQQGKVVEVNNGLGITNRFLDQRQNAQFYLNLIRSIAPEGSTIVFTEASFGNVLNRTLVDEFGNWLNIAIWQFLLALAVALYAAGRRFGLPVPDRMYERGTNELLISMGTVLRRGNKYDQALMILLDDAYERIRTALNAPLGTDAAELTKRVPTELSQVILEIRRAYGTKQKRQYWLGLARTLNQELSAFEQQAKSRSSRRF